MTEELLFSRSHVKSQFSANCFRTKQFSVQKQNDERTNKGLRNIKKAITGTEIASKKMLRPINRCMIRQ